MLAILFYLAVSAGTVALWRRYVRTMSTAAAIVLVLLPFCFVGRALLSGRIYAPIDLPFMAEPLKDYQPDVGIDAKAHNAWLSDLYMQMIPWQSAVRQTLAHGDWPLWNRHMLAGSILAANMQAAPYDPVQLLGFLLPHPQALTFGAAMTFFMAGLFAFSFARALGCGEPASLIGAAAYMFNGVLAFFVGWPIGRAWTFLPLILLGTRMIVHERSIRSAVVLTIGFVFLIFAGHPETVLHVVSLGILWGAYELVALRHDRTAMFRAAGLAALSGVTALLLTAISLLPFVAAVPHTVEFKIRHEFYANARFETPPEKVLQRAGVSLFPFYGGQPWTSDNDRWDPTSIRVGSLALALALSALVLAPRRREVWFLFALAILCTLGGLNAFPVGHFLHALPLFNITLNERLVFAACFALAMLAALAADSWDSPRSRIAAIVVTTLAAALGIGSALLRDAEIAAGVDPTLFVRIVIAEILPLMALASALALRMPSRFALPLVLGLVLTQRTIEDGSIYPVLSEKLFYPKVPILKYMQDDPQTPFRMVGLHFAFLPDAAALYGLEDARGYEAMTFRRLYETYPLWSRPQGASFNNVFDKSRPFLSLLNVKYAIGSLDEQPDEQWKLVLQDRQSRLLQNTRVLPRAFIPQRVRYERTNQAVLSEMTRETDFSRTGWITTKAFPAHEIHNGPGTLTIKREDFDYEIDARMDADGWVFVSECAWPGWRAYVDGKRVDTLYANHAFLGIFVPRGHHRLELVFVPEAFTRGRNTTLATIAGLIGFFVWRRRSSQALM